MKQQSGFTLIELVVVIVILGILAATALPKFVDLTGDAQQAAVKGVAGAVSSASAINYGGCAVYNNQVTSGKCVKISKCSDAWSLIMGQAQTSLGTTASNSVYYLTTDAASTTNGTPVSCTLKIGGAGSPATTVYSADFTVIGAAN